MMDAPSVRSGSAFCTVKSSPLTLMAKSLSKCSSLIDPRGANARKPALANRTSRRPYQNRILTGKADQHDESDLRENIVVLSSRVNSDHRRQQTHGYDQDYC